MIRTSGAGVEAWKAEVVLEYLRVEFPDKELGHLPLFDNIADLFRVIEHSAAAHQLRVDRTFYDRHDTRAELEAALRAGNGAERMRAAGARVVVLQ
jgi:hypothetical protein